MTKLKPVSKSKPKPKSRPAQKSRPQLPKTPSGIQGLDEITGGGLPKGRTTLVCGGAGSGKTLLAMEFLVHGATQFNEPGVFMAFEETAEDLTQNVGSLGFDLKDLIARKKMVLDFVYFERSEIEESGAFDLEGLFIRLGHAIDSIGAKRVVLDTIESLFADLPNPRILRAELRRLFRWLKEKGVTAIITAERGHETLTRQGLEEYVSDCVIVLDHRVQDQVVSRRLRVVKYRGSMHETNDFPFLIDEDGILVLPISSLGIPYIVSTDRIPSGIARLDTMLGGGYYRGSSVQVSGTAGTGKTSLAAHFAAAACRRGERVLYFPLKESSNQIMRNMRSIGIDLEPWVRKGLLQFEERRPTLVGLEIHLAMMHKSINSFQPQVVILDPMTSFVIGGNETEVKAMLIRLVDSLKMKQITLLVTSFAASGGSLEEIDAAMSPLMDTSLLLRDIELGGERNRAISIVKSRGMAHSNQIREFLLTDHGVELHDVYVGPGGVLTGAARLAQEVQEKAALLMRNQEVELRRIELERKRTTLEAQIAVLRAEFAVQEIASVKIIGQEKAEKAQLAQERVDMGLIRKADVKPVAKPGKPKGGSK
ncbi:MAG TPA: circadian clock protein KaiC [Rhodoferax sp.]